MTSNAKATATNRVHFACFDCRKAFKQPESSNWNAAVPQRPFACPNCKQHMTLLGKYFKAPPQRATRQWLKVELLYRSGVEFWSSHMGIASRCDTLPATIRYLVDSGHEEAVVRELLRQIKKERQMKPDA